MPLSYKESKREGADYAETGKMQKSLPFSKYFRISFGR